jgi:hypothetical protein
VRTPKKERALVLVKAFPQPSQTYEETVCCAGLTPDGGFVRLFPIRFRHLPKPRQFTRWDVIEYEADRPRNDSRPESRHVNEDTIRIVQGAAQMTEHQRVQLWAPHVSASMAALKEENIATERSLGIIKPDPGSLRFRAKRLAADEGAARGAEFKQVSLITGHDFLPELVVDYEFSYRFTCAGATHNMIIHDWEVQAAYFNWKHWYGQADLLERVRQKYERDLPTQNLHFVMGTMAGHRRTFIIIGLLRSSISPELAAAQASLI